jgi:hypothetical protein
VNSYIVKPVQFDQFANVIRDLGLYWQLINQPPVENNKPRSNNSQSPVENKQG